jgi:hypothetical protein
MKECDKGISHFSSKLHVIYIHSSNGTHLVTKNFTSLHFSPPHCSCQHFTPSHLNFSQLHFTLAPPHLNSYRPIRFEVFLAVSVNRAVPWDMSCSQAHTYCCYEDPYSRISVKCHKTSTKLYSKVTK